MKKKIALALILCCIIVLMICFSGCVEERQPTTTEKSQYIEGLRHIQATASRYSDDDYPTDYEGIDVAAIFIGERGYPLEFKGVPVNITVEVYGYSSSYDWIRATLGIQHCYTQKPSPFTEQEKTVVRHMSGYHSKTFPT